MKKMIMFIVFGVLTQANFNVYAADITSTRENSKERCKQAGGEIEKVADEGRLIDRCCVRALLPGGAIKQKPLCEKADFKVVDYASDGVAWCCHR